MAVAKFREPNRARWVGVRPGHDGEQVMILGAIVNATAIVYTVPAGKMLYLCEWMLADMDNATGAMYFSIRNVADVWVRDLAGIRIVVASSWISDHGNAWPPIEVPAGYDLYAYSSGAGLTARCSAHGWIESV